MKQQYEAISKTTKITQKQTERGYLYSFAIAINSEDREGNELTEWLQCSIFQKEERPDVMAHNGEFHIRGELRIMAAWKEYPQKLYLFGFYIEPVMKRIRKPADERKRKRKPQIQEAKNTPEDNALPDELDYVPF